jgi:phosphoglycolate phosphatase-like HAD superfamily hydrolase
MSSFVRPIKELVASVATVTETTTRTEKRNRKMEQTDKATQDIDSKITADTVLFFDMDGTLVDTNLANFLSYKKAILSVTKSNHDLTYNSDKRFNRSSLKNAVPNLTENEYERIIQEKEKYYNDFLHETKLNVETADILFKYSKTNKTVLVTNCRKDRAMTTLKHFGLDDKFSDIFCREFDDNGNKINKFQNAILKLDVPPNLVIAFENEEIEIADAQKVGISIINPLHQ